MTGLIFVTFEPTSFWLIFLLSELIGYLSTKPKEGILMIIKVFREAKSCVYKLKDVVSSQGAHHPYRFNLLTIWWNSSEKGE